MPHYEALFDKFSQDKKMTLIIIAVSAAVVFMLALYTVWYAYYQALPKVLKDLASRNKFIGVIPENTWCPITKSGVFHHGEMRLAGHHLTTTAHNGEKVDGPDTRVFGPLESWLRRRGFIWLGLDAPSITNFGTKGIPAARLKPSDQRPTDVSQWLEVTQKSITSLRLSFTKYVLVTDIELTDTHFVSAAIAMAEVEVVIPYLTWYGLGGQAYNTITTRIERLVRSTFEKYSLFDLLQGGGEMEDEVEEVFSHGLLDCLDLGVRIKKIALEEWDYRAPEDYLKLIENPKAIAAKEQGIIRELEMQQKIALGEVKIAEAKVKGAEAKAKVSHAEWENALKMFGGNEEAARNSLLFAKLSPEAFSALMLSAAIENTSVQVLGADALSLVKPKE